MSRPSVKPFQRFARALQRRAIFLHAVECGGAGLLVACGLSALLLPIWFWRELEPIPLLLGTLSLGLVVGFVGAFARRPSVVETLARADEQLGLHDLFGTAWAIAGTGESDREFVQIMLARAGERCQSVSPSELTLNRYGRRAWALLGLSVMLLFSVSLMSDPSSARARDVVLKTPVEKKINLDARAISSADVSGGGVRRPSESAAQDQRAADRELIPERAGEAANAPKAMSRSSENAPAARSGDGSSRDTLSKVTPAGAGVNNEPSDGSENRVDPTSAGVLAGASGNMRRTAGQSSTGSRIQAEAGSRTTPWQGANWPAARAGAMESVRSGRVPDAYRDVVRGYFERGGGRD